MNKWYINFNIIATTLKNHILVSNLSEIMEPKKKEGNDKENPVKDVAEKIAKSPAESEKVYAFGKVLEKLVINACIAAKFEKLRAAKDYNVKLKVETTTLEFFDELNKHIKTINGTYDLEVSKPGAEEAKAEKEEQKELSKKKQKQKGECMEFENDLMALSTLAQLKNFLKSGEKHTVLPKTETLYTAKSGDTECVVIGEIMLSLSEIRKKLKQMGRDLLWWDHVKKHVGPDKMPIYLFVCGCYCHTEYEEIRAIELLDKFSQDHMDGPCILLHFPIASLQLLSQLITEFDAKIEKIEKQLRELEESNTRLEESNTRLEESNIKMQLKMDEQEKSMNEFQKKYESDIASLREEIAKMKK